MSDPQAPVHGGDPVAVGERYGIDPDRLLDFSANLNPLGPPPALLRALEDAVRDVKLLGRYPDADARGLRVALAGQLDVDPEAIVVAHGAAALLGTSLAALRARCCVVPTPAFSEDRHAVRLAGAAWFGVPLDREHDFAFDRARVVDAIARHAADACAITNPHNPTGRLASRDDVLALVEDARHAGAATIVDEAFVDYAPEHSVTRAAATMPDLVVVRSLTKLYAVPALRVGYAVAAPDRARRMRALLPSWPVTTLASHALAAALGDRAYVARSLATNASARAALAADLRALGFGVAPSAANFLFLRIPNGAPSAPDLVRTLVVDAKIVVRDCSSYDGLADGRYVRVAVRSRADNARLVGAFGAALAPLARGNSSGVPNASMSCPPR